MLNKNLPPANEFGLSTYAILTFNAFCHRAGLKSFTAEELATHLKTSSSILKPLLAPLLPQLKNGQILEKCLDARDNIQEVLNQNIHISEQRVARTNEETQQEVPFAKEIQQLQQEVLTLSAEIDTATNLQNKYQEELFAQNKEAIQQWTALSQQSVEEIKTLLAKQGINPSAAFWERLQTRILNQELTQLPADIENQLKIKNAGWITATVIKGLQEEYQGNFTSIEQNLKQTLNSSEFESLQNKIVEFPSKEMHALPLEDKIVQMHQRLIKVEEQLQKVELHANKIQSDLHKMYQPTEEKATAPTPRYD